MPKILLISHCVPPVPYGPSFVFLRLFKNFPKDSYVVYTTYYNNKNPNFKIGYLQCKYYYAPAHSIFEGYTRWISIREWLEVIPMVLKGLYIIKKEKIDALLVYPTIGNFLLATYLMHLISNLPLSLYMLDCFSAIHTYKLRKFLSKFIEYLSIRAARNVFVMSEKLQEHYFEKYNINPILLPHPIDLSRQEKQITEIDANEQNKKKTIVFTGMIYEAQFDSIKNLINAIEQLPDIEFHIYTSRSAERLTAMGLSGDNVVYHGFVNTEKIPDIQREADLLFLPLAFHCPYPDIIKTASPSKLPEYLSSGRPILVHAPKEAYISWYAKRNGWGAVVDELNANLLRKMIIKIFSDKEYQETLIEKAAETALLHDSKILAERLKNNLNILS